MSDPIIDMSIDTSYTEGLAELLKDAPPKVRADAATFQSKDSRFRDRAKAGIDLADTGSKKLQSKHQLDSRSIVSRAKDSVLQFPIYITRVIETSHAHVIGKTFERIYASLVQTALAQYPIIDQEDVNNLKFLRQYHTNIKGATDSASGKRILAESYEPIDDFDRLLTECVCSRYVNENVEIEFHVVPQGNDLINKESTRLAREPLEGFKYLTESDIPTNDIIKVGKSGTTEKEERLNNGEVFRAASKIEIPDGVRIYTDQDKRDWQRNKMIRDIKTGDDSYKDSYGNTICYRKDQNDKDMLYVVKKLSSKEGSTTTKLRDPIRSTGAQLKDADVKKWNGMLPWTFEVTFRIRNKGKEGKVQLYPDMTFVIGVKTVLHTILIDDLMTDLRDIVMGRQRSLQKVRAKTGEISWLKDYFLNLKGLKSDAAKSIGNRKWLNTLKRLGEYERMNGTLLRKPVSMMTGGNVPIPNGTMVLTVNDVEELRVGTGINLAEVSHATSMAKSLFLISVVIVNPIAKTFRVLFPDSDADWDEQSLGALDADIAKVDNSQLANEINRVIRQ